MKNRASRKKAREAVRHEEVRASVIHEEKKQVEEVLEVAWKAAEFEHREKDVSWYWVTGIVSSVLALIALKQKNFFFLVFIVLAGIMVLVFAKKKPRVVDFRIDGKGVGVGEGLFYAFKDLTGFDINVRPGRLHEVVLRHNGYINNILKLPADVETARKAEKFLDGRVRRFKYEETLLEVIFDSLGF